MRKALFVAVLAAASLLAFGVATAGAETCSSCMPVNSVDVARRALIDGFSNGANSVLIVINFRCTGGLGFVDVTVSQSAAQSSTGTPANGTAASSVNCDGTQRKTAVNVVSATPMPGFGLGCADAMVTLTLPDSSMRFDSEVVNIVAS
jgi:hypothetical protein